MLKPLKLPTKALSPWKARSLLAKRIDPGLAALKKAGGLLRWAVRSRPWFATPALSRPGLSAARGSLVDGSCAAAVPAATPLMSRVHGEHPAGEPSATSSARRHSETPSHPLISPS